MINLKTEKQKRQLENIEEGYEERGVSKKEAARYRWATVNKITGGGKKVVQVAENPSIKHLPKKEEKIGGKTKKSR